MVSVLSLSYWEDPIIYSLLLQWYDQPLIVVPFYYFDIPMISQWYEPEYISNTFQNLQVHCAVPYAILPQSLCTVI